jgi:Cys-rich protein (TIGR01571 family)
MDRVKKMAGAAANGGGSWDRGLFGCFDEPKQCAVGTFLPCYAIGKTRTNMDGSSVAVNSLLALVCMPCASVMSRSAVRQANMIKGETWEDALVGCCVPCSICQVLHQSEIGGGAKDLPPGMAGMKR